MAPLRLAGHLGSMFPAGQLVLSPTTEKDGTFTQPFKVAFNDSKGANGPFGLSFQMTGPDSARFVVAWNNYFDGLPGEVVANGSNDKPDIYHGTLTIAQRDGKTWLYFAYVETRGAGAGAGRYDFKIGAAFVELP